MAMFFEKFVPTTLSTHRTLDVSACPQKWLLSHRIIAEIPVISDYSSMISGFVLFADSMA